MCNTIRSLRARTGGDEDIEALAKSVGVLSDPRLGFVATCGCGVILSPGQVMCGRCATR